MKKLFTISVVILISALSITIGRAQTSYLSNASGNWSDLTKWTPNGVPGTDPGDNVTILNTHTMTITSSPSSITNCTVNTGGILDASTSTLTVSGTFTLASGATFKQAGSVTAIPGSTSKSISSSSTYEYYGSQSSIPVSTAFGNFTWNSTAVSGGPAGSLTVNGDLSVLKNEFYGAYQANAATHTIGGNVLISGTGSVLAGKEGSGAGSVTWNIAGGVTTQTSGILRVFSGGTSIGANVTFNIGGNFANNGAFEIGGGSGTATLTFNGSSSQTVSGTPFDAQNVTIANSNGVVLNTDVGINQGVLALVSGALDNGIHLIIYSGGSAITRTAGTLNVAPTFPAGITITYLGSVTTGNELPTASGDLGDLTINTSGTITLGASATVNGLLTLTSGKLATGADTLTLTSAASMVGEGTGKYVVGNLAITKAVGTGASTLGGIGVSLDAGGGTDVGNVTVTRVSGSGGAVTVSGKTGINRKWTIASDNPPTGGRTLTFSWVSDDDNGKNLTTARVWKSTNSGTTWSAVGSETDVSGAHSISVSTTSFAQWTVSDATNPLPVELTSFTAVARNGKVELEWATATEVNNYGFEVERKAMNSWEKIGFLEGHGSTNAPQSYSFTDAAARVGKYSYRLKQIDRDGKFEYHQAVEVTIGVTPNTVWLDNNYPNPFNPSTQISFVLGTAGSASLKVFDLLGQEVTTLANSVFNAGEVQTFTFDASKYSSGIYYYQLKSGNITEMKKMLLLK